MNVALSSCCRRSSATRSLNRSVLKFRGVMTRAPRRWSRLELLDGVGVFVFQGFQGRDFVLILEVIFVFVFVSTHLPNDLLAFDVASEKRVVGRCDYEQQRVAVRGPNDFQPRVVDDGDFLVLADAGTEPCAAP